MTCERNYKPKSALIRHLNAKYPGKTINSANVVIRGEKEIVYESAKDYKYVATAQQEKADTINMLVETFGEIIYQ